MSDSLTGQCSNGVAFPVNQMLTQLLATLHSHPFSFSSPLLLCFSPSSILYSLLVYVTHPFFLLPLSLPSHYLFVLFQSVSLILLMMFVYAHVHECMLLIANVWSVRVEAKGKLWVIPPRLAIFVRQAWNSPTR